MRSATAAALILVAFWAAVAQNPPAAQTAADIDQLAKQVAGETGTAVERTTRLVDWINHNFAWSATDYQQRTPEEIIARRGGNCAELARVLARLLDAANVRYRWVSEINLEPYSAERQEHAEKLVQRIGPRGSVFGARHNDHRWLEVYDERDRTWVPADPAVGVVGVQPWIRMRLALQNRPAPALAATAEIVKDMIAPFMVAVVPNDKTSLPEDRSDFYLIEQFNAAYGGRLSSLPAWAEWVDGIHRLAPLAMRAFQGRTNLHEANEAICRLRDTFERLKAQAKQNGIA